MFAGEKTEGMHISGLLTRNHLVYATALAKASFREIGSEWSGSCPC